MSVANEQTRVDCCVILLNRHKNEGILIKSLAVMKVDPVWYTEALVAIAESWRTRELLVMVWWNSAGVAYNSFFKSGRTMTVDIYCQQLQTMMEEVTAKQPRLVNRSKPLLLYDNDRPHTAQQRSLN